MWSGNERRGWLAAAGAAAGVLALLALAGGAVAGGIAPRTGMRTDTPPAPEPGTPPMQAPATEGPAPAAPETAAAPAAAPLPRIIRVVCTDRVCGNCDGKCHRDSGHVAVDKKGHCACTPSEGSDLDRATREAYARKPPQ